MLKNRIKFLRKLYPQTIIIYKQKNEFHLCSKDQRLADFLKLPPKEELLVILKKYCINYIILDNLEIIAEEKFINNTYSIYYDKLNLFDLIKNQ